jgi:hypothetical protein
MPDDEEIRQNLFDVQNAIAQQRLEGLTHSREIVSDLERNARGEIPVREVTLPHFGVGKWAKLISNASYNLLITFKRQRSLYSEFWIDS